MSRSLVVASWCLLASGSVGLLAGCREPADPAPAPALEPAPAPKPVAAEPEHASLAAEVQQLASDASAKARPPVPPAAVRRVMAGAKLACAWLVDDRVMCWGPDAGGGIGDGSEIAGTPEERVRPFPVPVLGLPPALEHVGLGWAITRDGTTMLWSSVLWILDAGESYYEHRTLAAPWSLPPSGIVDLSLASDVGCVLTSGGEVECAGSSETLGDGSTRSRARFGAVPLPGRAVALSAGGARACAVLDDGSVHCWGRDVAAPRDPAPGCDGPGLLPMPILAPPAAPTPQPMLAPAPAASPAAPPTQMVDPCAPRVHIDPLPVRIVGVADALDVEVGSDGWACAIVRGGGVSCWGQGDQGELGDGTYDVRLDARPVLGLRGPVVQLAGSYNLVCARHEAGTVDCWGTGHTPVTNVPLPVPLVDDAIDVSVGNDDACVARRSDGNVWCWGWREVGFGDELERGVPSPLYWSPR